jgi:hypothetical protein
LQAAKTMLTAALLLISSGDCMKASSEPNNMMVDTTNTPQPANIQLKSPVTP